MIKAQIFTTKGVKGGQFTLPRGIFEVRPNLNLLAQVIHVYEERSHTGLRKTQTRSEVNRTTKKIYKQKGTGGARHGSRRANLFVGGGVALGPRPERRILKLSTALKNKAKVYAFSVKARQKEIVVVRGIAKIIKTSQAADLLSKLNKDMGAKRFTFVLSEKAKEAFRSLRNLKIASAFDYKDITALNIWNGGVLIFDQEIFKAEKPVKKPVKKTK